MMEYYKHFFRIFLMVALQGWFPGSDSQDSTITLPKSIRALRGSCVEIPCTFTRPRNYKNFNLVWYKDIKHQPDYKIFNHRDSSDVNEHYRRRTSLVGNEPNSCSLRINDVQETAIYCPYIHGNWHLSLFSECQKVKVEVSDDPNEPSIEIPTDLTEGESVSISCSVEHACPSSPPTLQWNKAGYNITYNQMRLKDGVWKATMVMEYLPYYQDHGTDLICNATYPSGLKSTTRLDTLNIRYSPRNVTVVIFNGKKELKEGDDVTLVCISDANPAANDFIWYNNKRNETVEMIEEHGQNIINVTVGWDREKFTARNPLGTRNSKIFELQVLYKAKHVTIKGKEEMKDGAILELECHFLDYNPPTTNSHYSYSWYLNGNPVNGKTGRILQINNITKSSSGNYSCNVQNRAGDIYSSLFAVTVMSAQTGEDLPMGIILGGVAGAVLVIILALALYLFLRKLQKRETPGGRRMETNIQSSQSIENPYAELQTRDTAIYDVIKP